MKWEGGTLVFESGSHPGPAPQTGVWADRREPWSLEADGRLRVVITTRGSGGEFTFVSLLFGVGQVGIGFNPIIGPVRIQVRSHDAHRARVLLRDFLSTDDNEP